LLYSYILRSLSQFLILHFTR